MVVRGALKKASTWIEGLFILKYQQSSGQMRNLVGKAINSTNCQSPPLNDLGIGLVTSFAFAIICTLCAWGQCVD